MQTVVMLDASKFGNILNQTGFSGLDALLKQGDKFFFSEDTFTEASHSLSIGNQDRLNVWLQSNSEKIVSVAQITESEKDIYDPKGKRHTSGGGNELWDMSARKFMLQNEQAGSDYVFRVISDDSDFKREAHLFVTDIDKSYDHSSYKKLMINLTYDPDLDLSRAQFDAIVSANYQTPGGLGQGVLNFPRTYEDALAAKVNLRKLIDSGSLETVETIRKIGGNFDTKGSPLVDATQIALLGATIVIISVNADMSVADTVDALGLDASSMALIIAEGLAQDAAVSTVVAALSSPTLVGAPLAAAAAQVLKQAYNLYQSGEDIAGVAELITAIAKEITKPEFRQAVGEAFVDEVRNFAENQYDAFKLIIEAASDQDSYKALFKLFGLEECFGPEVLIDMWPLNPEFAPDPTNSNKTYDQSTVRKMIWRKPISDVRAGDWVVSFDKDNSLVPGYVPRTKSSDVKILLDYFGTKVTPGHVYYRADSEKPSNFEPLLDILCADGVIQKQDGSLFRAATNVPIGDSRDEFVVAVAGTLSSNGSIDVNERGRIRLGTRFLIFDGIGYRSFDVADLIFAAGGTVDNNELVRFGSDEALPFHWDFSPSLPKPEDFVLACSGTTLEEIERASVWERYEPNPSITDILRPSNQVSSAEGPRNTPLKVTHNSPSSNVAPFGKVKGGNSH